jgi:hypothetical protein
VVGEGDAFDRPGDAARSFLVDRRHPGVLLVRGQVDLLGLLVEVAVENLLHLERPESLALVAAQLDRVSGAAVEVGGQGDRDRPVLVRPLAGCQPHLLADASPVLGALEAGERREAAVGDQLEIGRLALAEL